MCGFHGALLMCEFVLTVTALVHSYGGFAFWDYATAAPYVHVNMNPRVSGDADGLCRKDAVFFSFHKFIGGVQVL